MEKKCYILCKFGYTPYREAPPQIYQHKSVFTIVFTKKDTYSWADMTPILSLRLLYPFQWKT